MRRLLMSAGCGTLTLLFTIASLAAAPAPAPRTAAARKATTTNAPRAAELRATANRTAPGPKAYQLAEPSPTIQRRYEKMVFGGRILMYTGMGLSGLGLTSTIIGAVLIALHKGPGMQTGGVISLVAGAVALAGGVALWAVGQWRVNKADELLIKARLRQVQLEDPARRRPGSHALLGPKTNLVFSAQLRF